MQRANVLRAALFAAGVTVCAASVHAQATVGADLNLYSSYVWRGLTLTNKPVAQPDLYVTVPVGGASITAGGWSSFDLGKHDNPATDISESGGLSSFNLAEFDWWGEISYPVGKATLTGGATGYIYPNDANAAAVPGLLTKANNTVELYAKAAVAAPLSPKVAIYYDVDKIKGAYIEGAITYALPASEKVGINLGALAGFSAGQGVKAGESANFAGNGFTHLDLSAGVPLEAGVLSITPVLHLVIAGDDFVKVTSPTKTHNAKLWGGVSISWSKALGEAPKATDETPQ